MRNTEYKILDSDSEEHTIIASYYEIADGFVCFWNTDRLAHSFYKPIYVLSLGLYKDE